MVLKDEIVMYFKLFMCVCVCVWGGGGGGGGVREEFRVTSLLGGYIVRGDMG